MKKISIKSILEKVSHTEFIGNKNVLVDTLIELDVNQKNEFVIFWCNDKNIALLANITCGTVICSAAIKEQELKPNCNYIISNNPRLSFAELIKAFFKLDDAIAGISDRAVIGKDITIGKNVYIAHNVVIEDHCTIGDNTRIDYNTVIKSRTHIGNNVKIGCNNTIGNYGFGYQKDEEGNYQVITHVGGVIIMDDVEIGNNTCIDRGLIGNTVLHKNAKVDNLVHIAHGVDIGENTLVIAHAIIGGSTKIGNNCWIAPNASVINKITIGNNVIVGIGAVVLKPVGDNEIVVGNPGKLLGKK